MQTHRTTLRLGATLLLTGCTPSSTPAWAADSWWIESPADPSTQAFLTWAVYGEDWDRTRRPRHFVCAEVWRLELRVDDSGGCEACTRSWLVSGSERLETDCADMIVPEAWIPEGFAVGERPAELREDPPADGLDVGSYVTLDGPDWLAHGWAYVGDSPEGGREGALWQEGEPMQAWPAWAVDLRHHP